MDRKKFLHTSGLGLGLALMPGIMNAQIPTNKTSKTTNTDPKIIKDPEGPVLNVIGDVQTHKLTGTDTNNQLVEWVDNVDPGVGIPPHIHTKEDEVFRVIKGQIEISINGKSSVLSAGDMAFAPKNIPHAWKVIGTEKAKMITSAFPAGIEHMFQKLAKLPPGPPDLALVSEICAAYGIRFV